MEGILESFEGREGIKKGVGGKAAGKGRESHLHL